MKVIKGIGLFLIYPLFMLILGFFAGVKTMQFFYPGMGSQAELITAGEEENPSTGLPESLHTASADADLGGNAGAGESGFMDVSAREATLSVDTEYILEENDILRNSVVETRWRLPAKYVGMNREQFIKAMKQYETTPPLSEQERGFVSLEVMQFSRERVVIQMNYRYVQPSSSFYLAVSNNEVVVLLEDKETVYINTGIRLEELPEETQQEIIEMLYVENEVKLYDILETYSS
ncbi:MAG: hypothetical protein NC081_05625 [Roseburia sp.]|nr:hypothetical protein [Roseburia sp.]